jgi:phage-related tail fiber protein
VIETIIPSDVGGFTIREMGNIANGKLISHGSHAPFEKVADPSGVSEYRLRFTQNVTDGSVVELTLDESLIYATQAWIDENYIKRSEIVDNLTTDDVDKVASARTVKELQDNKLGKNENAASATNCGRSVVAGNGLSGGGELNANRTVTLGTPSTVTALTANITTSTSHTHNLDVNSLPLLGVGQTWQKPSRSLGATYTNDTGKPIQVFICANLDVGSFNVSGVVMDINDGSTYCFVNCVIPDGATYSLRSIYGGASIVSWAELR